MENPDFSVVLPAFNEARNLPKLVKSLSSVLKKAGVKVEIIAVDNGSSDNTPETLEELKREIPELKSLKIYENIGFGNGVIKGLEASRASVLGYMNADGQVSPEDLLAVYLKLKEGNYDLCKGKRLERYEDPIRKVLSRAYNLLFGLMFSCPYQDINASPKVFIREFYEKIRPSSKDWFLDAEIMMGAARNKVLVGEVPIISLPRKSGKSKVSVLLTSLEFSKNMFYWRIFKR